MKVFDHCPFCRKEITIGYCCDALLVQWGNDSKMNMIGFNIDDWRIIINYEVNNTSIYIVNEKGGAGTLYKIFPFAAPCYDAPRYKEKIKMWLTFE